MKFDHNKKGKWRGHPVIRSVDGYRYVIRSYIVNGQQYVHIMSTNRRWRRG